MQPDKDKILKRLKTARGQINGIINMIEEDQYCIDISNQLLSSISLLKSTNKIILSDHIAHCVKGSIESKNQEDIDQKLDEIEMIIEKLMK